MDRTRNVRKFEHADGQNTKQLMTFHPGCMFSKAAILISDVKVFVPQHLQRLRQSTVEAVSVKLKSVQASTSIVDPAIVADAEQRLVLVWDGQLQQQLVECFSVRHGYVFGPGINRIRRWPKLAEFRFASSKTSSSGEKCWLSFAIQACCSGAIPGK